VGNTGRTGVSMRTRGHRGHVIQFHVLIGRCTVCTLHHQQTWIHGENITEIVVLAAQQPAQLLFQQRLYTHCHIYVTNCHGVVQKLLTAKLINSYSKVAFKSKQIRFQREGCPSFWNFKFASGCCWIVVVHTAQSLQKLSPQQLRQFNRLRIHRVSL